MLEQILQGCTILIAEDEYLIANDIKRELVLAGAKVLGPVASLEGTIDLVESSVHIDAAILDVNLRGEKVFPAAELLDSRGVPFVFATGYDRSMIPPGFDDVTRCEKPIGAAALIAVIGKLVATRRESLRH